MANQKHLDLLKQGVEAWNQWRKEHPYIEPDLSGADLSEANLRGARLSQADLSHADLSRATLISATLTGATFTGANLSSTRLHGAALSHADLSGANLSHANLYKADLSEADLSHADLSGADLSRAILVRTNLCLSTLKDCSIYGISVWDVQLEGAEQLNLKITSENQPTITVDNLKVAQFIYLLLNNQELRGVLNAVTEKGVLLLGRFSDGGLEILQSIAAELRKRKYLPMLFDFERPDNRNYTETVKTLVGLARFVIVDLSGPSVPQELDATIPHFKIPFVPILEKRRKVYSMFRDLLEYPWVLKPVVEFENKDHLISLLPSRVIKPAEEKSKERQELLQQLFNR